MDYIIPAKFFNGKYNIMRRVNLNQWREAVKRDKDRKLERSLNG